MATKEQNLQRLIDTGVVAVMRVPDPALLMKMSDAIVAGGVDIIEFTMTTPNALDIMAQVAKGNDGKVLLGAGTVLDPETARSAILAGADFVVSPTLNLATIEMCHRYGKMVCPGCFTPTEILTAWECGADIVKVFPATALGPKYFKDVFGPLPQVRLMPTGGVNLDNAGDFIKNGACAIGVGGNLVDLKAAKEGRFDSITEAARQFSQAVKTARGKA
jgi:2-dehydro-3-deoxyphosphogluconate aldolase / (4S)-4-hydroxy-2-oxoglutarate aldolase